MKKNLLTLGLLGLSLSASAQFQAARPGPWTLVNTTSVQAPPRMQMTQFQTLSPTFCWILGLDNASTAPSPPQNLLLTSRTVPVPPATTVSGDQFVFNSVSGTTGFQPTNISAVNQTLAFCGQYATGATNGGGGEVIRTTNGGARWRVITTPTQFAGAEGFCNFIYMFDANEGVSVGDPNPLPPVSGAGVYEIQRITNASATPVTWTRVTGIPAPLSRSEYGIVNSYFGLGNTLWFGTNHDIAGVPAPARVFRTTDRGLTWNVYNTPFTGSVGQLAFKDQNNGIAYNITPTGAELMRTTDGGVTWALQALPTDRDTLCGRFYRSEIGAIPGKGFISIGGSRPVTGFVQSNFGVSFSPDGISWVDLERGVRGLTSNGLIACASAPNSNAIQGYIGGVTNAASATNGQGGQGGVFQVSPTVCASLPDPAVECPRRLATRDAALQRSLTVYPNPSANGQFNISLTDGIKAGTQLAVFDIMGRVITTRTLNATAVNAKSVDLDLSGQKSGVYTLRLSTAEGIATEKLVIQ